MRWGATDGVRAGQLGPRQRKLCHGRAQAKSPNSLVEAVGEGLVVAGELARPHRFRCPAGRHSCGSRVIDTVSYREPLGVFAGIVPFNFPAMILFGWLLPHCITTGNILVPKLASQVSRQDLA